MNDLSLFDAIASDLASAKWIFAKTMPKHPHHYTLRAEWSGKVPFDTVVDFMRGHGYDEMFFRKKMRRLNVNWHKYWSMGAPIKDTILINRAIIDTETPYDAMADSYDCIHDSEESAREERFFLTLAHPDGEILDIGCGTGMLAKYIGADNYLGVDPSRKMLNIFRLAHPDHPTVRAQFEDFYTEKRFDTIVAMFGAASYLDKDSRSKIKHLLKDGGRFFLMFYGEGYYPKTYRESGFDATGFWKSESWNGKTVGNYRIIEGGRNDL